MKVLLTLLSLVTLPVWAQHALYVQTGESAQLVRDVRAAVPYISEGGTLVPATSSHFLLQPTKVFAPVFVSVRNVQTADGSARSLHGAKLLREIDFSADFESPTHLEHVYLILELFHDGLPPLLFLWGVGELKAHEPRHVEASGQVDVSYGTIGCALRVFTDGAEVLQSRMAYAERAQILDPLVAAKIAGLKTAAPRPFIGPFPEYPEGLRRAKIPGSAVLNVRLGPTGLVTEATIKSASDPALGSSAMEAITFWRFLPYVKDGHPVEAVVTLPFTFGERSPASNSPAPASK